jgi:hypothetical protein
MVETHSSDEERSLTLDSNDDAEQLRTVSQEEEEQQQQCEEQAGGGLQRLSSQHTKPSQITYGIKRQRSTASSYLGQAWDGHPPAKNQR